MVGESEGADWPISELRIRTKLELGSPPPPLVALARGEERNGKMEAH